MTHWTKSLFFVACSIMPAYAIYTGWPVAQSDLAGVYHYAGGRTESIELKPNHVFYWSSTSESGEKVQAQGNWQNTELGWSGWDSRQLRLETVTFRDGQGKQVKFSGGACSGGLSELESSTPSCVFNIHSNRGQVVSLGMLDIYWVKQ